MKDVIGLCLLAVAAAAANAAAQEVTLPLERYDELRAASRPASDASPAPPAPYALESAEVELHAGRTSARVTQWLTVALYASGWQTVPVAASGSITAADLGGLAGHVRADKDGLALVLRGQGRHRVRLESVVPLAEDAEATRATRTLRMPLPRAAAVDGVVIADDETETVEIVSGAVAREAAAAHARWGFVGTPGGAFEARLLGKPKAALRRQLPLRFDATASTVVTVSRTRLRAAVVIGARVRQGQLDALHVGMPAGFTVLQVTAPGAGWEAVEDGVVVTPAVPVEGSFSVSIDLAADLQTHFASPIVVPRGAGSTRIVVGTRAEADGVPEIVDVGSARAVEEDESAALPEAVRGSGAQLLVVRDAAQPPVWDVSWNESGKVLGAQVDRLLVDVVYGEGGRAAYQCWALVRSTGATQLALGTPARFHLTAAERDGAPVTPGRSDEGLVVPLDGGSDAQVVHIAGVLEEVAVPTDGSLDVLVPAASAPVARVEVRAVLPGGRSYTLASPERAGAILAPPAPRPVAPGTRGPAAARRVAAQLFAVPAGAVVMQGAWSALSAAAGPLSLRVKPEREKEGWF